MQQSRTNDSSPWKDFTIELYRTKKRYGKGTLCAFFTSICPYLLPVAMTYCDIVDGLTCRAVAD